MDMDLGYLDRELVLKLKKHKERLELEREIAEEQIDIDEPWNYHPSDHQINLDKAKPAITWAVEAREGLERTSDSDLKKIASRMEDAEEAFVKEFDETNNGSLYYKSLFLTISTQDGLLSWLCDKDRDESGRDPNNIGEEIYNSRQKKNAIEKWYNEYSPMDLDEGEGEKIKEKWEKFFNHRHRIMHGHPDADFDGNLALAALFFLGVIGFTTKDRYDDL